MYLFERLSNAESDTEAIMKRVLSLIIALMMLLSLAACGSNNSKCNPDTW